jgi:SAM-dependent methyltransferase
MSGEHPPVCSYEGSDYQTSFWEQGRRSYEDRVEAVALRRLLPNTGSLLLELGAGAGRNTSRYSGFDRVVLLDYSLTQLQQALQRLGHNERYIFVAADIYRLPFVDGLFDSATMIRTLHHMADAPQALRQVRRVLLPEAAFILEYASKHNLKAILRYLLRRQDWSPFSPQPVEFTELNYDFHPRQVRAWLALCGFELQRQLTVSHFRLGLFKRLLPLRVLVWLDSIAQLTGDLWQLSPSVFTLSLASGETPTADPGDFFQCPACGNVKMAEQPATLICPACGKVYPIVDGIYDFRAV